MATKKKQRSKTPKIWESEWNQRQAVLYLLLKGVGTDRQRALKEAVTSYLKLGQGDIPGVHLPEGMDASALQTQLTRLRATTKEVLVEPDSKLWPVLWIRVFQQADIPICEKAVTSFARWRWKAFKEKKVWLMQQQSASGGWSGGSRWELSAPKSIAHGLTMEQMLLKPGNGGWPYHFQWRLECFPKPSASRSRAPVHDAERVCGRGAAAAVRDSIHRAAEDFPHEVRKAGDFFTTALTLGELTKVLRKKYKSTAGRYSQSTVVRALPSFVEARKGRPTTKSGIKQR
ncbi:hypothetical protein ACFPPF_09935 [Xenophilus aerolatus]|nr:hypothetical protein [Xenophilus aerolatus]